MASSSNSHQRNYTARISNQEWERWKDEITIEFLGDKAVKDIVEILNNRGLNVTYVVAEHSKMRFYIDSFAENLNLNIRQSNGDCTEN